MTASLLDRTCDNRLVLGEKGVIQIPVRLSRYNGQRKGLLR
jgi:hypothetical protein